MDWRAFYLSLVLVVAVSPPACAGCPERPSVGRMVGEAGIGFVVTGRATALSLDADDLRSAHFEARLAALALLAGESGFSKGENVLVGVLPVGSCEDGLMVTETLAIDPKQSRAAEDLSSVLKARPRSQ